MAFAWKASGLTYVIAGPPNPRPCTMARASGRNQPRLTGFLPTATTNTSPSLHESSDEA